MGIERAITVSAHGVRAILQGRKTVLRQLMTPNTSEVGCGTPWNRLDFEAPEHGTPEAAEPRRYYILRDGFGPRGYIHVPHVDQGPDVATRHRVYPRIEPGGVLWVRETFAIIWRDLGGCIWRDLGGCPSHFYGLECSEYDMDRKFCSAHEYIEYRADTGNPLPGGWPEENRGGDEVPSWRRSIHMPRWASRINLEVTDVRPERLHDITEEDAIAEGVEPVFLRTTVESARGKFADLWDSINGKRPGASWVANPWVWRIAFRPIKRDRTDDTNIEASEKGPSCDSSEL